MKTKDNMKWDAIKRFNFTWAIPGGAWLEDSSGYINWEPYNRIVEQLGKLWWDRQRQRQGWMTGCWIDVNPDPAPYPGTEEDFAKDTILHR